MRLTAHIPEQFRKDGIAWIILEDDPLDTKGIYLFFHSSLDEPSEYDSWHETLERALNEAEEQWGVRNDGWASEN